jgi:hypothetical protein
LRSDLLFKGLIYYLLAGDRLTSLPEDRKIFSHYFLCKLMFFLERILSWRKFCDAGVDSELNVRRIGMGLLDQRREARSRR